MLGGALWHIKKDTDEVVYAVDCNHVRESLLDGGTLGTFRRPGLLITSARDAHLPSRPPRRERDRELLEAGTGALGRGGDVLLPVDTAGRVLELVLVLEAHWRANRRLARHPVLLLHHYQRSWL